MPISNFDNLLQGVLNGDQRASFEWAYYNKHDFTVEEIDKIRQEAEKLCKTDSPRKSSALNLLGHMYFFGHGTQDYNQAMNYYKEAIKLDKNPFALGGLAHLYIFQGDIVSGISLLKDAIASAIHMKKYYLAAYAYSVLSRMNTTRICSDQSYNEATAIFDSNEEAKTVMEQSRARYNKKITIMEEVLVKLNLFKEKIVDLEKKGSKDNKKTFSKTRADCALILSDRLYQLASQFVMDPVNNQTMLKKLIDNMQKEEPAKLALEAINTHQGLKQLFVDIVTAILTLGGSLIYKAVTGGSFFKVNTDTANKYEEAKESLSNFNPASKGSGS